MLLNKKAIQFYTVHADMKKHPVNTSILRKMRHEKDCFTNHIIRKLVHYYMADSKIGSSSIELGIFIMDVPPQT